MPGSGAVAVRANGFGGEPAIESILPVDDVQEDSEEEGGRG